MTRPGSGLSSSAFHRKRVSPTLFKVQIQPDSRLRTRDLFSQPLLELFHICHQSIVLCLHQSQVVLLVQLQLRLELRKVYFLRIALLLVSTDAIKPLTFSDSALETRATSIPLMLSSTTSASTVMTPSAWVLVRPSVSSRSTKRCVSKCEFARMAVSERARRG
jgi:hypothetical protein